MDFFLKGIFKDLQRRKDDPWQPAMWVGIPLVIAALITLAMGGSEGPQVVVDLLVADEDESFISGMLLGALSQDAAEGLFRVEHVSQQEGRRRVEDGEVSALLVVPEGFGAALLREEPSELLLLRNPSQQVLPQIAEETVQILVDGSFYAHRIMGEELRQIAEWIDGEGDVADLQISTFSVRINQIVRRVSNHLDPLAIELETTVDEEEVEEDGGEEDSESSESEVSVAFYFFPGMLMMALFFMSDGLGADIWRERDNGTLRRLITTPRSISVFLASKCAAACIFIAVVSAVLLALGYFYHGRAWGSLPIAVLWMVLSGSTLWSILTTVQLFASSERAGTVLTSAATFPLLMLGGSFFPFEAMPDWMAAIGRWTPNGWMLEHLKSIVLGNFELTTLGTASIGLVIVFAAFLSIANWRLTAIRSQA